MVYENMYRCDYHYSNIKYFNLKIYFSGFSYFFCGLANFISYGMIGFAALIMSILGVSGLEDTVAIAGWYAAFLMIVALFCFVGLLGFIFGLLSIVSGIFILKKKINNFCLAAGILNMLALSFSFDVFLNSIIHNFELRTLIIVSVFGILVLLQIISIFFINDLKNYFKVENQGQQMRHYPFINRYY